MIQGRAMHTLFQYSNREVRPSLTASADIYVLTQEELDNEYSDPEAVNYKLIGTDCYSIESTHLDFSATDRYKPVTVSLDPENIKSMITANPDAVWVLPLQVVSENDSVNSEKNEFVSANNRSHHPVFWI